MTFHGKHFVASFFLLPSLLAANFQEDEIIVEDEVEEQVLESNDSGILFQPNANISSINVRPNKKYEPVQKTALLFSYGSYHQQVQNVRWMADDKGRLVRVKLKRNATENYYTNGQLRGNSRFEDYNFAIAGDFSVSQHQFKVLADLAEVTTGLQENSIYRTLRKKSASLKFEDSWRLNALHSVHYYTAFDHARHYLLPASGSEVFHETLQLAAGGSYTFQLARRNYLSLGSDLAHYEVEGPAVVKRHLAGKLFVRDSFPLWSGNFLGEKTAILTEAEINGNFLEENSLQPGGYVEFFLNQRRWKNTFFIRRDIHPYEPLKNYSRDYSQGTVDIFFEKESAVGLLTDYLVSRQNRLAGSIKFLQRESYARELFSASSQLNTIEQGFANILITELKYSFIPIKNLSVSLFSAFRQTADLDYYQPAYSLGSVTLYEWGKINLENELRYHGKREDTQFGTLPAYWDWNLGLSARLSPAIKLRLEIDNVLDQVIISKMNYQQPGRVYQFGADFLF